MRGVDKEALEDVRDDRSVGFLGLLVVWLMERASDVQLDSELSPYIGKKSTPPAPYLHAPGTRGPW